MRSDEPFIAIFFKGISIVTVGIAIFLGATEHDTGIALAVWLMLGAAPAAWWMGSVIQLLSRIAENGTLARPQTAPRAEAPVKPQSSASGASKVFVKKASDDDGTGEVPTFKL
jgi:hypothetical protein